MSLQKKKDIQNLEVPTKEIQMLMVNLFIQDFDQHMFLIKATNGSGEPWLVWNNKTEVVL